MNDSPLGSIIRKLQFILNTHLSFVLTLNGEGIKKVTFYGDEDKQTEYLKEISVVIDYETESLLPVLKEFRSIFLYTDSQTREKHKKEIKSLYESLHGLNAHLVSFCNELNGRAPKLEYALTDYALLLVDCARFIQVLFPFVPEE